jgi:hypothetical protein
MRSWDDAQARKSDHPREEKPRKDKATRHHTETAEKARRALRDMRAVDGDGCRSHVLRIADQLSAGSGVLFAIGCFTDDASPART